MLNFPLWLNSHSPTLLGEDTGVGKHLTTRGRNSPVDQKLHVVVNDSAKLRSCLFSPAMCLSVSVLPDRCVMIHNHHSASPSTSIILYGLSQSGAQNWERQRERPTAFQSGAQGRLLSTPFLKWPPGRWDVSPSAHSQLSRLSFKKREIGILYLYQQCSVVCFLIL